MDLLTLQQKGTPGIYQFNNTELILTPNRDIIIDGHTLSPKEVFDISTFEEEYPTTYILKS